MWVLAWPSVFGHLSPAVDHLLSQSSEREKNDQLLVLASNTVELDYQCFFGLGRS